MRLHATPCVPRAAAGLAAALLGLGVASSANDAPAVVFKTRPPAVGGVISGRGPLDVTFNMCPTSDTDPGDQLKFTYDFDGDGSIDYYGHCRQTHRYPASNQCLDATVCASDRNPGHRLCRTYTVCASGRDAGPGPSPSPPPSPSPSPSPDILPFTYDLYAFTAKPGTNVDVSVDTVSAATAFDPWACISTTPDGCALFDENVIEWGDDDQACTFPPPTYECPAFSATLPADDDGVYYLLVSDAAEDDFAGPVGLYALHLGSDLPIGPLVLKGNNVPDPSDAPPAPKAHSATSSSAPPDMPPETVVAPAPTPRPARPGPVRPAPPNPTGSSSASPASAKPTRPEAVAAPGNPGTAPAITSGAETREAGGPRPEAVFRTEPRASAKGRITGGASFDVTFDLCASKSPDPGRDLAFTYDLDGNGVMDSGPCRQTRRYTFDGSETRCLEAVACVGDGQKDHEACRTYTVCAAESPAGPQ